MYYNFSCYFYLYYNKISFNIDNKSLFYINVLHVIINYTDKKLKSFFILYKTYYLRLDNMQHHLKLLDWIPVEKIDWTNAMNKQDVEKIYIAETIISAELKKNNDLKNSSKNWKIINSFHIKIRQLEEIYLQILVDKWNLHKKDILELDWSLLSGESTAYAISMLKQNHDKIDWEILSENSHPYAIELLKKNPEKIKWTNFSKNAHPYAIELIKSDPNLIDLDGLAWNTNPEAIKEFNLRLDSVDWEELSWNETPHIVELLRKNKDKIDWYCLSTNENRDAIRLLEENPERIHWSCFITNPSAIHIIEQNQDKINWKLLSVNPAIFELDYTKMNARMDIVKEEMMKKIFHPSNHDKFEGLGFEI